MDSKKFFEAMSHMDDKYYEEAASYRRKRGTGNRMKWGMLAACVCLLAGSVTALGVSGFGTQVVDFFTSRVEPGADYRESGYDMSVEIEKIPVTALKGEIRGAGDLIRKQFQEVEVYDSWYPGQLLLHFDSGEEARAYIGFDSLKGLDWDLDKEAVAVSVFGDKEGRIFSINTEMDVQVNDLHVQFLSWIYTENDREEITLQTRTTEAVGFAESFYTTESNQHCHIIEASPMESGYLWMEGSVVEQGVLYQLHIAYQEKDASKAMAFMHQWAELF